MTLHIVNKSPHSSDCLDSCLQVIGAGDALLLIEDGVYAAPRPDAFFAELDASIAVYALKPDLEARGLALPGSRVKAVSDTEFVALTVEHSKSLSWF